MKHLLTQQCLKILTQFALSNVLIAFDYDGTLSPIVANRNRAPMRRRTHDLLARLCAEYPCAVISGRAHSDVSSYLEGIEVRYVVGNHGLEPTRQMERYAELVLDVRKRLAPALEHLQGVEIEDKRYSLAIHYRRSRQATVARKQILNAVSSLAGPVRLITGKRVFNVLPEGAPHKGIALQQLRKKANADTAIYVGDDVTDEDVFELDEPGRLLSVRVGRSLTTAAPYYLKTQMEVDRLLSHIIRARKQVT